jgi:hypothetical protein
MSVVTSVYCNIRWECEKLLKYQHVFPNSFSMNTLLKSIILSIGYILRWCWQLHFNSKLNTLRSFPHSWLIIGFVTRLAWRVSLVQQELLVLPEHLSSPPALSGVRVNQCFALCVCFVDRCLSFSLWPLCCLSFELRILITLLVSSNAYDYCSIIMSNNGLVYNLIFK